MWYELKEETIDRTMWRIRIRKNYGHERQIAG
jgi:hypothetical protein